MGIQLEFAFVTVNCNYISGLLSKTLVWHKSYQEVNSAANLLVLCLISLHTVPKDKAAQVT